MRDAGGDDGKTDVRDFLGLLIRSQHKDQGPEARSAVLEDQRPEGKTKQNILFLLGDVFKKTIILPCLLLQKLADVQSSSRFPILGRPIKELAMNALRGVPSVRRCNIEAPRPRPLYPNPDW